MKRTVIVSVSLIAAGAAFGSWILRRSSLSQEESSIEFVTLTPANDPAMIAVNAATAAAGRAPAASKENSKATIEKQLSKKTARPAQR